jgi:hypothetical protein
VYKKQRKNEILKASVSLMYLKGYNGTSEKEITDRSFSYRDSCFGCQELEGRLAGWGGVQISWFL